MNLDIHLAKLRFRLTLSIYTEEIYAMIKLLKLLRNRSVSCRTMIA